VHALCQMHDHVAANDERAAILEQEMREAAKEYAAEGQRATSMRASHSGSRHALC